MSRPSTGQLVWQKRGWSARVWREIDGERVRVRVPLDTANRAVAARKLERLLADESAPLAEAQRGETFREASERVNVQRVADGVTTAKDELARLRTYAFPVFENVLATAVETSHVNAALDYAKAQGKAKQTVAHVRQAIRIVFESLKREGAVKLNPCDDAAMPRFPKVATKETAVLEDSELLVYLVYQHPEKHHQLAVLERQTMSAVSRCFGGLRTNDLHKLNWQAFEIGNGEFARGWAPRVKTRRPQLLEVPAVLRPILRDWWERQGRPVTGPVFPALRGKRAGEAKGKVSHALALRRDLRRALGVETWNAERRRYEVARALTPREVELFEPTEHTEPVDFHSWRRAFTQALANAAVNVQTSAALSGHASLSAHQRYLANSGKARAIPLAALPDIQASAWPKPETSDATPTDPLVETSMNFGLSKWAGQGSNLRHPACKASALPTELPARTGRCFAPPEPGGKPDSARATEPMQPAGRGRYWISPGRSSPLPGGRCSPGVPAPVPVGRREPPSAPRS
jgi:integrase